jgi:hypothetical protein
LQIRKDQQIVFKVLHADVGSVNGQFGSACVVAIRGQQD